LLLTLLATPVVYSLLDELWQGRAVSWQWAPLGRLRVAMPWRFRRVNGHLPSGQRASRRLAKTGEKS
jgi:hypothetical protein